MKNFKISFCVCDDKIIRPKVAAMIEEVDTNGDGQINFEEFVNMMTFWSIFGSSTLENLLTWGSIFWSSTMENLLTWRFSDDQLGEFVNIIIKSTSVWCYLLGWPRTAVDIWRRKNKFLTSSPTLTPQDRESMFA